ncbi:MAG: TRAP transporter substrate-binding protein DctP [Rhizobiales bacterium]|nr:TRAP transporter substrate-binding protein DctP [Hyphomicrobiales bacterium]
MRFTLTSGIAALALSLLTTTVYAADKVEIIFSDTVSEGDIRTKTLRKEFGGCLGDGFNFKSYHGATLFKQGTELTAMQRGNLDMGNLAIFDFYNQVPHTKVLGVPFLYRNYEHLRQVWSSGILDDLLAEIEDKAKVKLLANPYIGARHLGYKGDKKIMVPADLNGVKLRMPPGEGWQLVGRAMGATTVPIPFTEVYTALQTGAIDGQDNAFPAVRSMKFDEVLTHIGKTAHQIANNSFSISMSKWNSLNASQQTKVQDCAINYRNVMDKITLDLEVSLEQDMIKNGLTVYTPDLDAFLKNVVKVYAAENQDADWPEGLMDKITAIGK